MTVTKTQWNGTQTRRAQQAADLYGVLNPAVPDGMELMGWTWEYADGSWSVVIVGDNTAHRSQPARMRPVFAQLDQLTVDVPGAFDSFFSGTGVGQGQLIEDDLSLVALHTAYRTSRRIGRSARGYRLRFSFTDNSLGRQAIEALIEYADACVVANADTVADRLADPSDRASARTETAAARTVIARCRQVLAPV